MILITAASGMTGRHLVPALRQRGQKVRALARSASLEDMRGDGVQTLQGDMLDPATLRRALDGVSAVIHIGPAFDPLEEAMGRAVVDGALAAGVPRLVQFSVYHPEIDFLINHQVKRRVEEYVVSSGLRYTILEPMHYMQNIDPAAVVEAGVLRLPYSLATPLAFVDLADVAEVAARVLTEDGHDYATYPLCGSDVLSGDDLVKVIARISGSEIVGEEIPVSAVLEAIAGGGRLPRYVEDGLRRLFGYYGLYGIRGNANVLRWVLAREPTSFAQYVRGSLCTVDHAPR